MLAAPRFAPLLLASALASACGPGMGGADGSTDAATGCITAPDAPAPSYAPPGFTVTPELSPTPVRMFVAAEMVLEPNRDYAAVLETDAGRIVIDLTEAQTPATVNSFVFLARNHFFDGVAFHRVIQDFVAQGGDPNTLCGSRAVWGTGGPGYGFGLEVVPDLNFNSRGVVGMARTMDPNSNGSQFFITLAPSPSLNNMYTVFGRVIEGDAVLDAIARNVNASTPPTAPTRMTQVYIVERAR